MLTTTTNKAPVTHSSDSGRPSEQLQIAYLQKLDAEGRLCARDQKKLQQLLGKLPADEK